MPEAKQNISWWRTSLGEEEIRSITEAISSENISQGKVTAEFERQLSELLGVPYVVATTSGSTAILMALIAAGVGPGDEVIVPNRTWIATAHAPFLLGAKVVLADVIEGGLLLDPAELERKITARTKAVIPVHLNGRSTAMEEVTAICSRRGVTVIEDAAQALCSRNRQGFLGTQSFAGCFSLSIAKIITTGQGGFVVTREEATCKKLKAMRTHGVDDVINCSYTEFGFNFRFTDIQASVGLAQLQKLQGRIERVGAVYDAYEQSMERLPFLQFLPVDRAAGEIPLYVEVLCEQRERLIAYLAEHGVQTRPFYPDLDKAGHFAAEGDFPNSRIFGERGLFLPCGPDQPIANIERTISLLERFKPNG